MEYFMNSKNLFAVSFGMDEIKLYNFIMPSKKLELGMERYRLNFFIPFSSQNSSIAITFHLSSRKKEHV